MKIKLLHGRLRCWLRPKRKEVVLRVVAHERYDADVLSLTSGKLDRPTDEILHCVLAGIACSGVQSSVAIARDLNGDSASTNLSSVAEARTERRQRNQNGCCLSRAHKAFHAL